MAKPITKTRRDYRKLTPERRRQIASLGGHAAAASGRVHRWTPEEARRAREIKAAKARLRRHISGV